MKVELLVITPDAEALIEYTGRVCWRTELSPVADGRTAFIKALIHKGHLSVVEHPSATFEISGISRSCSHQLVRHRLSSFSQESMRYVDMTNQKVITPPAVLADQDALIVWQDAIDLGQNLYRELRSLGIQKEDARFGLPIGTATRLVMTENFRFWRHFIELRCSKHAQWEIREVAAIILKTLYHEAPAVFGDLYKTHLG